MYQKADEQDTSLALLCLALGAPADPTSSTCASAWWPSPGSAQEGSPQTRPFTGMATRALGTSGLPQEWLKKHFPDHFNYGPKSVPNAHVWDSSLKGFLSPVILSSMFTDPGESQKPGRAELGPEN